MIRSATNASISRTRSPSTCFSASPIRAILSSVIAIYVSGFESRTPNLLLRTTVTASIAMRVARGFPHYALRHYPRLKIKKRDRIDHSLLRHQFRITIPVRNVGLTTMAADRVHNHLRLRIPSP